jgi:hypothetical protein
LEGWDWLLVLISNLKFQISNSQSQTTGKVDRRKLMIFDQKAPPFAKIAKDGAPAPGFLPSTCPPEKKGGRYRTLA